MKPSSYLPALIQATAGFASQYRPDDCARALSEPHCATSALSDCRSYLACTVTPAASTSTVTLTSTLDSDAPPTAPALRVQELKKRDADCAAQTVCPNVVPEYATACSDGVAYASACSNLGVSGSTSFAATPVKTTYVVATVKAEQPSASYAISNHAVSPAAACGNFGMQWALYNDSWPYKDTADLSKWDPNVLATRTPMAGGNTRYLNYFSNGLLYGNTISPVSFAVDYRGWLLPPQSGTYTFTASIVDDLSYLWIGDYAYKGATKDNSDQVAVWDSTRGSPNVGVNGTATSTFSLTANTWYPIRIVHKQGGGPGYFVYSITAPDGSLVIGNSACTATSP